MEGVDHFKLRMFDPLYIGKGNRECHGKGLLGVE
jgi:hypothetical protein